MPGLDGLELQQALTAGGSHRPVIFITGKGDIPTSVRAMKAGAIDFLTKPVSDKDLLGAIARAEEQDTKSRQIDVELASIHAKIATLTPREREVLTHVVAGRLNKQIAGDLGTVEKTIKVHRGRMMEKLGVRTVARPRAHGGKGRHFKVSDSSPATVIGPRANSTIASREPQYLLSWRKLPPGSRSWTTTRPC